MSNAKFLVTGDKEHLLPLKIFKRVKIVDAVGFYKWLRYPCKGVRTHELNKAYEDSKGLDVLNFETAASDPDVGPGNEKPPHD